MKPWSDISIVMTPCRATDFSNLSDYDLLVSSLLLFPATSPKAWYLFGETWLSILDFPKWFFFAIFRGSLNVWSHGLDLISVWLLYNSRFSNGFFIIKFLFFLFIYLFIFLFSALRNSISSFWLRVSWSLLSAFPCFEFDSELGA